MNSISWNCCGLGKLRAIPELTALVRKHSPPILFSWKKKPKNPSSKIWKTDYTLKMFSSFQQWIPVEDSICIGKMELIFMFWMLPLPSLMWWWTQEWMMPGSLWVFTEIRQPGTLLGTTKTLMSQNEFIMVLCLEDSNKIVRSKEKWVGQTEGNNRWWSLEVPWIFVAFKTWALLATLSHGVIINLMGKLARLD